MIQDITPSRLRNEWKPEAQARPESPVFLFEGDKICVTTDIGIPRLEDFEGGIDTVFLFEVDGEDYFLIRDMNAGVPEGFIFMTLREIRSSGRLDKKDSFAAYTAYHLNVWYKTSKYCGRCGHETNDSSRERARVCPECGNVIYPRINPSVIIGVLNHDRSKILLTKYAGRSFTHFALVAGFTEIGETLEQTVMREVTEEVGLKVRNITYYKSQPWGTGGNILAGFYCEVDSAEDITMDRSELSVAGWYAPEDVELQPDDFSLTNEMMRRFKDGLPCLPNSNI